MSTAADQPTGIVKMVTLDCADPGPVSSFYAEFLGLDVAYSDENAVMLVDGSGGPALGFGRVPDYQPPAWPNPNGSKQYHLDLAVDDIAAAESRCLELGATLADPQPGETWRVLIDPAGHPFCLTNAANWG
ncbi:VOC family protein [Microlunatus ginsengisoli]|uniref:VOC family protein n=1 Tax=Microlunatus ginsengisoli TaxID=363863 RepID=A0ABP7AT22_9ACTN